jgi:hypothetical protein
MCGAGRKWVVLGGAGAEFCIIVWRMLRNYSGLSTCVYLALPRVEYFIKHYDLSLSMQLCGGQETETLLRAIGVPLGARQAILYMILPGSSLRSADDTGDSPSLCDRQQDWSLQPASPILWGFGCSRIYDGKPCSEVLTYSLCTHLQAHVGGEGWQYVHSK